MLDLINVSTATQAVFSASIHMDDILSIHPPLLEINSTKL